MTDTLHHVVIIGGGFGGLQTARALRKAPVRVTLVDRRNFHLFQPLLYQVATGSLSPANIAAPLRALFTGYPNIDVRLAEVTGFDVAARTVRFADGGSLTYDTLVVAAGASHSYFGHPEWEQFAGGLKSIEDATLMRQRILLAFERADQLPPGPERDAWMSFAVVGGGPTGVELLGQLAEISDRTLVGEFRSIKPEDARIHLVEAGNRVLAAYPEQLSAKAAKVLEKFGVEIHAQCRVTNIDAAGLDYDHNGVSHRLPTRTVLWAAGNQASPLAKMLGDATGAEIDRAGRVAVGPDLSLPSRPEVFAIGDMALLNDESGRPLPGIAPVAMQQGKHVAAVIRARLRGETTKPFRYRDLGTMATIGRTHAVAVLGRLKLSGLPAWIVWLVVHLMAIVQFQNRVLILMQWAWHFFTDNRSARLITNLEPVPEEKSLEHATERRTDPK
jgi:NADH dehydrogenase